MQQSPTISCPLKVTTEVDWVRPLKEYIAQTYGDPEKYHEECMTLNRLRQDMRGAGKDSTAGRDLLYRYYGQLELLDLRFPVEERGVKVAFTWYDAFTHKQTSQYSLAFEKASIIFNISAVHSCHAANQNRSEEVGVKTAFHSFQAAAGMFTYINENFLHAPSTDLSRDTVKTLISIMLAQAQEVFLEKQIADGKKSGMLAKLAAQAGLLYAQATEGVQENTAKGVFDKSWVSLCSAKQCFMDSLAQYLQALTDCDNALYGQAVARLELADSLAKEAVRFANSFPSNPSTNANLSPETGPALVQIAKRHHGVVHEKLIELSKDNDYIYHDAVPSESAIPHIPKMPAAKAIPVQELYANADINRIIGPDIFQKIVPMSVTESASLYDEEKAKLIRAETEKVDIANAEMVAALDYLKLPHSLKLLKNGFQDGIDVADEFRDWCEDMATKPETLETRFIGLKTHKKKIMEILDRSTKALDHEEAVCEKMRSKYLDEWTQQPSSRLTQTLRSDIRSYKDAVNTAVQSDNQLWTQYKAVQNEIQEMTDAGDKAAQGAVDRLWAKVAGPVNDYSHGRNGESLLDVDDGEGVPSVMDQIQRVEDLLKKLNLIKRERAQVLKDLKDKVHNDDISNILILNKKAVPSQETSLFQSELEKFRTYQNRLVQCVHKQSALMKELTAAYGDLLQDRRIRAEQSRYEALSRQRNSTLAKFKKTYQSFLDIWAGLEKARAFYSEMMETAESLDKNVETFVANRRSEGAMLLSAIEKKEKGSEAERNQQKLHELVSRMSIGSNATSPHDQKSPPTRPMVPQSPLAPIPVHTISPPSTPRFPQPPYTSGNYGAPTPPPPPQGQMLPPQGPPPSAGYTNPPYPYPSSQQQRPESYQHPPPPRRPDSFQAPGPAPMQRRDSHQAMPPTSPGIPPPSSQQYHPQHYSSPPGMYSNQMMGMHHGGGFNQPQPYNPSTYVPPPPPPGPPPAGLGNRQSYGVLPQTTYQPPPPPPPQQYGQQQQQQQPQSGQGQDPWAGLAGWR